MTVRQARLQRQRNIKKRNMQKKAFTIVTGFLLIAAAEIAAAAFIMYCKNSTEVRGIEILFIILAGTAPAMLFEKI